MLLCCITLSSSRENQHMLKRQQEGFLAPLPGRSTPSQAIPSTHHKLFSLALLFFHSPLVFLSPTSKMIFENLCLFFALLSFDLLFACVTMCPLLLASLLAKNLSLWILIHLLIFLRDPIMMSQLLVILCTRLSL